MDQHGFNKSYLCVFYLLISCSIIIDCTFYGQPFNEQDLETISSKANGVADSNKILYMTSKHAKQNLEWSHYTKDRYNHLFGQVTGLAATPDFLYVFHRGNISWNQDSFNRFNEYRFQDKPIAVDTIVAVDLQNGDIMFSWGKDRFYLPHGISVDPQGNLWLTDVALHQVFRYKNNRFEQADLVLGERFVPGSDDKHFCKPTDVAVATTGSIFISDGYCNSRIVLFSPNGTYKSEFGNKDNMLVLHSLALLEVEDLICVADRENGRILCYSAGLINSISSDVISRPAGILLFELQRKNDLNKIYAIAHLADTILALNGGPEPTLGVSIDLGTEQVVDVWSPYNSTFYDAHDLTITPNGKSFFVCQLNPSTWTFNNKKYSHKIIKFDLQDYPVLIN